MSWSSGLKRKKNNGRVYWGNHMGRTRGDLSVKFHGTVGGDQDFKDPIPRFSNREMISHGVQEGQRVNTEAERQSSHH